MFTSAVKNKRGESVRIDLSAEISLCWALNILGKIDYI